MDTLEARQQYLLYAQQQQEYYETVLWILFTVFVIAPIVMAIIYFTVLLIEWRRGDIE